MKQNVRQLKKNVGKADRILRLILAGVLVWLGLGVLGGAHGEVMGIAIAITALMPLYMSMTGSCFVFRWCNIHSLSKKEQQERRLDP